MPGMAAKGFPKNKAPEKLCKPEESPVNADSFTQIYILFAIDLSSFQNSNGTHSITFF